MGGREHDGDRALGEEALEQHRLGLIAGVAHDHRGISAAEQRGIEIRAALKGLPLVGEIRGQGLLIGIGLTSPVAGAVVASAAAEGLIVNAPNETSIRLALAPLASLLAAEATTI